MENVNKVVDTRCTSLEKSRHSFSDIFNVMFSKGDYIFAEYNDGYRIYSITFSEALQKIRNIAYSINQKYPKLNDEYIGIAIESSYEWVYIFWAILLSGNKPYLINLRHPVDFVNELLKSLNIKYNIGNLNNYDATLILLDSLDLECSKDYQFHFANEMALSTSATTLKEKIIFYTGEEITCQILNCKQVLKENKQVKKHYKGRLKQLVFLPLYHIFGFIATYMWFSFFGRTMVFLSDYSSNTILRTIRKHEVTHIFAVPLFWDTISREVMKKVYQKHLEKKFEKGIKLSLKLQRTFKNNGDKYARRLMKDVTSELFGDSVLFCISGGSYIKDETLRIINGLGYPLYNGYGMSEIGITSVELGNINDRLKNSIGHPFESIKYQIKDNVLYVYGTSISHKMKINGEYVYNKDFFNTNDLANKKEDGRYYISGRVDDLFIGANGENISPDLLEKEYNIDKAIRFSILNINNQLSMIIQIESYTSKDVVKRIYDSVLETTKKLDSSHYVSKIYFTYDEIQAKTAIKVSRQYLLKKLGKGEVKLFSIDEMKENVKEDVNLDILAIVKEEMAKSLGLNEVSDTANFFFDLEGNSLDYFSLISTLNDRFHISITFEDNKNYYTAIELAKEIERQVSK